MTVTSRGNVSLFAVSGTVAALAGVALASPVELHEPLDSGAEEAPVQSLAPATAWQPWLAGSSVTVDPRSGEVLVADSDNGAVIVSDPDGREVRRRIAVGGAPEQIVVGPDGRAFVSLREGGALAVIAAGAGCAEKHAVGDEPFGLALSPDGAALHVSLARPAEVVTLDAASLKVRARARVARDPRGITAAPDGKTVYVAHMTGSSVSVIEPDPDGRCATRVRALPLDGRSFGRRTPNIAFAVAIAPTGDQLYVPHVLEDTNGQPFGGGGYGGSTPILSAVSRVGLGVDRSQQKWLSAGGVFFGGFDDGEDLPVRGTRSGIRFGRALLNQPRALVVDGLRDRVFVAGFGSDEVVALATGPDTRAMYSLGRIHLGRGAAPKGLALSRDGKRLYVHASFQHALAVYDVSADQVRARASAPRLVLGEERLAAAAVHGRELFHRGGDLRISARGALACASCHPEGRHDGAVWSTPEGPRKTPVLADRLAGTAPYDWRGQHRTLTEHVQHTITKRIGGTGLPASDLADLERYLLDACKLTPRPEPSPLARRGEALFHSNDLGCADCHAGTRFLDGKRHDLGVASARERAVLEGMFRQRIAEADARSRDLTFGRTLVAALDPGMRRRLEALPQNADDFLRREAMRRRATAERERLRARASYDTPSLVGVVDSAPYLHDGSAATLHDLLVSFNHDDRMGFTSHLSPCDVDALVEYLRVL